MDHRGRFQAQGSKLEQSEAWAQMLPITIEEGRNLLIKLENKLTNTQRTIRAEVFQKCREAIEQLHAYGGYNTSISGRFSKSYPVKDTARERVDLEIHKGIAFAS